MDEPLTRAGYHEGVMSLNDHLHAYITVREDHALLRHDDVNKWS